MIIRLAVRARNAINDEIARLIDAAGSAGSLSIYAGQMPSSTEKRPGFENLLGTLTFSHPCAASSAGGILTFSPLDEEDSARMNGHAAWARLSDGDGNAVIDFDVGDANSDAVIQLNTCDIRKGGPIRIKSFVITAPGA